MAKDPNFPMQGKLGGMGGQYGRKAENLTKSQLKRSGALKASKRFTIDITQTRRVEGSGVTLGPKGKPLTGSVKLANGKIAVYKAGKRVVNKPVSKDNPKPPPPPSRPKNPGMNMGVKKRTAMAAALAAKAKKTVPKFRPRNDGR